MNNQLDDESIAVGESNMNEEEHNHLDDEQLAFSKTFFGCSVWYMIHPNTTMVLN
jgi:hypothetical protein